MPNSGFYKTDSTYDGNLQNLSKFYSDNNNQKSVYSEKNSNITDQTKYMNEISN